MDARFKGKARLFVLSAVVFISGLSGNVSAEIYKWSDSENKTIYSDRPPQMKVRMLSAERGKVPVNYMDWKSTPKVKFYDNSSLKRVFKSKKQTARVISKKRDPCVHYRKQIDGIQSQLRAGYTEPKGNKLRAKRRALSNRLYRECR
ncbi:MAG: hypothetical protein COB51_05425 [Moraxellaceae bacterium]|nr:MAG: hypothetical protein COB51_05425 [Moraxellaceae bacterium]